MTSRIELFDRSRRGEGREPAGAQRPMGAQGPPGAKRNGPAEVLAVRLGGERIREGRSSVLKVSVSLPLSFAHGSVDFEPVERLDSLVLKVLFPRAGHVLDAGTDVGDLVFFDTETTGLSGGAGTLVFLAGTLRLRDGGIQLTQHFLENLASEKLFLSLLREELGSGSGLVSYNGRSFDANILRNRFVMNGFRPEGPDLPHFDLLYPSRRIWRGRLPDFTLQTIERRVLGVVRRDDIPGHMIPEAYFRYLREREAVEEILTVFAHNRTDALSLLALFAAQLGLVGELFAAPEDAEGRGGAARSRQPRGEAARTGPVRQGGRDGTLGALRSDQLGVGYNPGALSDMLAGSNFGAQARRLLEANAGDPDALRKLGFLCKRERLFDGAVRAFRALVDRAAGAGHRGLLHYVTACTELSKLCEHGLKDFAEAKRYAELALRRVERAMLFVPGEGARLAREAEELARRLHRLDRKLCAGKGRNALGPHETAEGGRT